MVEERVKIDYICSSEYSNMPFGRSLLTKVVDNQYLILQSAGYTITLCHHYRITQLRINEIHDVVIKFGRARYAHN